MKKIILSLFAIVAVAGVAGFGSYALWSDSETAEDNAISAGSLNLLVDGADWDGTAQVNVSNVFPGASDTASGTLSNVGSIDGDVTFQITSIVDHENTRIEPEEEDGDTTTGALEGELCDALEVTVTYDGVVVYSAGSLAGIGSLNLGTLGATDTKTYEVMYSVPGVTDNTIMTDACEFDMSLVLNQ